ncbi:MAG: YheT family hydrolase [Candidatus Acidiferrales bacterium]
MRRGEVLAYISTVKEFQPHPWLRNGDLMTLVATKLPRRFRRLPPHTDRQFETEPGACILGHCHWQAEPRSHPTLVMVHGLEGSSDSLYMKGTAEKAWVAGFNVLRLNQRNCGGTEHLTATLYNSGLSCDYRAVLLELIERDGLPEIFFCGHSMGGNLVLKMAGEFGDRAPAQLRGVVAVSPALELGACADLLDSPRNFFYRWHFLRNLKSRFRRKVGLFPQRYSINGLARIRTIREFDDVITAPHCGYQNAVDYYHRASSMRVVAQIRVPTLILTAQDDPFIPAAAVREPAVANNPNITVVATKNGGHCGFVATEDGHERFWAEARTIEFCRLLSVVSK